MFGLRRRTDKELILELNRLSLNIASLEFDCLQFRFGGFESEREIAINSELDINKRNLELMQIECKKRGVQKNLYVWFI
tara:strand:+ start:1616 stop:1852 length:237 start_codon:yes stop_codon:yes gene_type:complete